MENIAPQLASPPPPAPAKRRTFTRLIFLFCLLGAAWWCLRLEVSPEPWHRPSNHDPVLAQEAWDRFCSTQNARKYKLDQDVRLQGWQKMLNSDASLELNLPAHLPPEQADISAHMAAPAIVKTWEESAPAVLFEGAYEDEVSELRNFYLRPALWKQDWIETDEAELTELSLEDPDFTPARPTKNPLRMALLSGGSKATEQAVRIGLDWLVGHQSEDGHWDSKRYESGSKADLAVTSMAMQAMLARGEKEATTIYRDSLTRAAKWIFQQQAQNGLLECTTDGQGHRSGYPHALAGCVMAELIRSDYFRKNAMWLHTAKIALQYSCEVHPDPDHGGWRYHAQEKADTSVSSRFIFQLYAARRSGLKVSKECWENAFKYLDTVEKPGENGAPSTFWYQEDKQFGSGALPCRLTSLGNLCRIKYGEDTGSRKASVDQTIRTGGLPNSNNFDLEYWHYTTLAAYRTQCESWPAWNAALIKTLLESQRDLGDERGSWDPCGDLCTEWGRVGQTALSVLCLEVYYRE